jgi:hypothetical protein
MTKQEALTRIEARIAKVKAIQRASNVNQPGVERFRRTYLSELQEVHNQLVRELES